MARRWNVDACIGWCAVGLIAAFILVTLYAFAMRAPIVISMLMEP